MGGVKIKPYGLMHDVAWQHISSAVDVANGLYLHGPKKLRDSTAHVLIK